MTTFSPHLRKGVPECEVTAFPDGSLLLQIGSHLVHNGGEAGDVSLQGPEDLRVERGGLFDSGLEGDGLSRLVPQFEGFAKPWHSLKRLGHVVAKVTLKWPFLALLVLAGSCVLLAHATKPNRIRRAL